jgi:hypothetical protein
VVSPPLTDLLTVKVDGLTQLTFNEPATVETGYTRHSVNLLQFADGNAHTIAFEYVKPSGGEFASFNLDDVSLDAACGFNSAPVGLVVDTTGKFVFQLNETVQLVPTWRNVGDSPETLAGNLFNFVGPPGGTYTINDATGSYGTIAPFTQVPCTDCYSLSVDVSGGSPTGGRALQHWDTSLLEMVTPAGATKPWIIHIGDSFTDVTDASPFYRFVETLFHRGITGGCGPDIYCPAQPTTREQMAVFVLVAKEGSGYSPPACAPPNIFNDVPETNPFCRWIEELARRGVVSGCGGGAYCPTDPVTREQMGVFVAVPFGLTL